MNTYKINVNTELKEKSLIKFPGVSTLSHQLAINRFKGPLTDLCARSRALLRR